MSAVAQLMDARPSIFPDRVDQMKLEVFDTIPPRHIAYAVPDGSCMPLAREGEVLVVKDMPRHYPQEGRWFLIQWVRPQRAEWERPTVHQTVGIPREVKDGVWAYGPPCQRSCGMIYCGDGFFSFDQMTDYIRGPVVGIYRPRPA